MRLRRLLVLFLTVLAACSSQEEKALEIAQGLDLLPGDAAVLGPDDRARLGSGKPMREFLWSEEMADACIYIMENINFSAIAPGTSLRGGTTKQSQNSSTTVASEIRNTHINIGTGKEISIHDLANLIKNKVGFNGEFVFNTEKPDGTMRKLTDVSKLHSLGWNHKIDIKEGLEKMYNWYIKS